jgi:ribosomal protein S18 acetylase RimI-like enzyme
MDNSGTLRPVTAEDTEFLYEVYASTRQEELAVTGWSDAQKEEFLRMQFTAQKKYYEANYPGAEFQIILLKDQPIGRLYVHRTPDEIRIMDIALLTEFRRKGIGSWLLKKILAEGAKTQTKVGIHVELFNPALHLYEKLGFKKSADRGVYLYLVWEPTNQATNRLNVTS